MENSNTFDWLAVQNEQSDKTLADIYSMGINPEDVTLQDKKFYKDSSLIQKKFADKDGKFDEGAFNQFYLEAEKSLNSFKNSDFNIENVTIDLVEDTSLTRFMKMDTRKNSIQVTPLSKDPFSNLKVAQESFLGVTEINKWSTPKKTIQEVAQGRTVKDGITGKDLGYKPEDTGLTNLFGFLNEPLVLAQYDKDTLDATSGQLHKKGDLKFDASGLPSYETLAGRDPSGKQVMSRWDTLTREDSYANKFDFMDSDGFDKSMTGMIVKNAVQLAPFAFGGPVASLYKAFYVATGFIDGVTEIGKSLDGIMNGDSAKQGGFYKGANKLQGITGQIRTGQSQYGRDHFFGMENILSMATDSVYQLMGQKFIVEAPMKIAKYQMAKQLGVGTADVLNGSKMIAKYGDDFMKAATTLSKNSDELAKVQKYASYVASGYMMATSAKGISDVAENLGLDARDKGLLYIGLMSALGPLFRSNVGRWVEQNLEIDELAKGQVGAITNYAKGYGAEVVAKNLAKTGTKTLKERGLGIMAAGRDMGKHVASIFDNLQVTSPAIAALAEGVEEFTEWGLQEVIKGVYNGLAYYGLKSTKQDLYFKFDPATMAREAMANVVGGALGGAVFYHMDKGGRQPVFLSDDMMEYVDNGYGRQVVDKIKDLQEKGQLGSTTMTFTPLTDLKGEPIENMWKPVNSENTVSQNDAIANKMIAAVKIVEDLKQASGIRNPSDTADGKSEFFNRLIDTKMDTDLRDQIKDVSSKIYNTTMEISNLSVDDINKDIITEKNAELKELKERLEYLQSDESNDEYFRQGLFNIRTDINSNFGVKTKDDFAKIVNSSAKEYKNLSGTEKDKADELYNEYKLNGTDSGYKSDLKRARIEYEAFDKSMEDNGHYDNMQLFEESMKELDKYTVNMVRTYSSDDGEEIAKIGDYGLEEDFIEKLKSVKYVPDFIWNKIKTQMSDQSNAQMLEFMNDTMTDYSLFKKKIIQNPTYLKSLLNFTNTPETVEFLKKHMGSKYDDLINSDEFKELNEKANEASEYAILKVMKMLSDSINPSESEQLKADLYAAKSIPVETWVNFMYDFESGDVAEDLLDSKQQFMYDTLRKYDFDNLIKNNPVTIDDLFVTDMTNLIKAAYIQQKLHGQAFTTAEEIESLVVDNNIYNNNPFLDLLITGKIEEGLVNVDGIFIKNTDTAKIDDTVKALKDFNKERVASPLTEALKTVYDFINREYFNLQSVGEEQYINTSADFDSELQKHLDLTKRMGGMVNAVHTLNPLVNDFRKNNPDMIGEENKGIELTVLEDKNGQLLMLELQKAYDKIKYLKDVNDYNKNNLLAKQLKDRSLHISARVKTLVELSSNPLFIAKLPALSDIYKNKELMTFADNYLTGGESARQMAFYQLTNLEHAIYDQFSKLKKDEKIEVINQSFKPVDTTEDDFYADVTGETAYNEPYTTIYLATIFGTSSLDFYTKTAGPFDSTLGPIDPMTGEPVGLFSSIDAAPHVPFSAQENAVRIANITLNGDEVVKNALYNAYGYEKGDENIDYNTSNSTMTAITDSVFILGLPGTGKSTAVAGAVVKLTEDKQADVLLLAPKQTQIDNLFASMVKSKIDHRIDKDASTTLRNFLMSLNIQRLGKPYNFAETDKIVAEIEEMDKTFVTTLNDEYSKKLDLFEEGPASETRVFKEELANKLSKYRLIVMDEYTHINAIEMGIFTKIIQDYNISQQVVTDPSLKINLVFLGDDNQMGYRVNGINRSFDSSPTIPKITTPPLTMSLRSGWDVINNTTIDLSKRTRKVNQTEGEDLTSTAVMDAIANNKIKLAHVEEPGNNLGMMAVNKSGDTTADNIKFITDNKDKFVGKELVYVVDEENIDKAKALMQATIGENWINFVDIYTPTEVQGGEYKYAIIDTTPKFEEGNMYAIRRVYEFLNTMLSRATEATLLLDDGSYSKYAKFENNSKEKAILQQKIDETVTADIKANFQNMMKALLLGKGEAPTADSIPKMTPEEKEAAEKSTTFVFQDIVDLYGEDGQKSDGMRQKIYNGPNHIVMSNNTFMVNSDLSKLFTLKHKGLDIAEFDSKTPELKRILMSYKQYLLHKEELGDNEAILLSTSVFKDMFTQNNLAYDEPEFFFEITKRGEGLSNRTTGPTTHFNFTEEKDDDIIGLLKVKIPYNSDDEQERLEKSVELSIGFLNDPEKLANPAIKDSSKESEETISFFKQAVQDAKEDKPYRSEPVDWDTFKEFSETFTSILKFTDKPEGRVSVQQVKDLYPTFMVTEPQVVVAKSLDLVADTAKEYAQWKKLSGKSVVFISEIRELGRLSPVEIFNVYKRQLALFHKPNDVIKKFITDNNLFETTGGTNSTVRDKFMDLTLDEKKDFIASLDPITFPGSSLKVPIKPNLIKLIKVDNPVYDFTEFIERFKWAMLSKQNFKGKITLDMFKEFDLPIYVKDRLMKSFIMMYDYIKTAEGEKWFVETVLKHQQSNAATKVQKIYDEVSAAVGENVEFMSMSSSYLKREGPLESITAVREILHSIIFDDVNPVIDGKLMMAKDGKVDKTIKVKVDKSDLEFPAKKLTRDKNGTFDKLGNKIKAGDFDTGYLFNVSIFQLFNRLKNVNFTDLMSISLQEFAKIQNPIYNLGSVFKDGLIETAVYAKGGKRDGDNTTNYERNPFAPSVAKGSAKFTFGLEKLTISDYSIDFKKFLDAIKNKDTKKEKQEKELEAKIEFQRKFDKMLEPLQAYKKEDFYKELKSKKEDFKTIEEVKDYLIGTHPLKITKKITLTTVPEIEFFINKEGLLAYGGSNMQSYIMNNVKDFENILETVSATKEFITVLVKTKDGVMQVTMSIKEGKLSIAKSMIQAEPESNIPVKMKEIENEVMTAFEKIVKDNDLENPITKPVIDFWRENTRYQVVSANVKALGDPNFTLESYDAKLAAFDPELNSDINISYLLENTVALKPYLAAIKKISRLNINYKPTIC